MPEFDFLQFLYALSSGAIGSVLMAPIVNDLLQKKRILKEQKAQLLKDLMATRFDSPLDQRGAEAINYIPILFAGDKKVLSAYAEYHSAVLNNASDRSFKFNGLLVEIAENIGIDIHLVDLMRPPLYSKQRAMQDSQCNAEFAVFNNNLKTPGQ